MKMPVYKSLVNFFFKKSIFIGTILFGSAFILNAQTKSMYQAPSLFSYPIYKGIVNENCFYPSEKRFALVIGVWNYLNLTQLPNDKNDVEDMKAELNNAGFDVMVVENPNKTQIKKAVTDAQNYFTLNGYNVALVYVTGHGAQLAQMQYLLPVDANTIIKGTPANAILKQVMDEGIVLTELNYVFADARYCISLVDACRENASSLSKTALGDVPPIEYIRKSENYDRNLSMDGKAGVFFATNTSNVSSSSAPNNRNSLFTYNVINCLREKPGSFDDFANTVVRKMPATQKPSKMYTPWDIGTNEEFRFYRNGENKFAYKIKDLLYKIDFNSTLSDVLKFEYGSNVIIPPYDKYPIASECTNNNIRYAWRPLGNSKIGQQIVELLKSNQIYAGIDPASSIVYFFKDNKLIRISLRIYSNNQNFNSTFMALLGQDMQQYPTKYETVLNGNHYISGASFNDLSTEIITTNEEGYDACVHDWWHK